MAWCRACHVAGERDDGGLISCPRCGRVIAHDIYSNEPTFMKTAQGQNILSGNYVKTVDSNYSESYERTLRNGEEEIKNMIDKLRIGGGADIINQAKAFHKIAVNRNFTRGRTTALVTSACLYIACRLNKKPFLLIDFSEELGVDVYTLGSVFLQLWQLLRLGEQATFLVDPALFIPRFAQHLLKGRNIKVENTALHILASMKRDWMQTGRKPSGLCGAALYISALSFGIKCSKADIASVVHMCQDTLTKRLMEFESTESGSLTIEELNKKANELRRGEGSRQLPNMGVNSSGNRELLCKHKGSRHHHFAHGLCERCYNEFIELSGGLQGGSDPPAFQQAERERVDKPSSDNKFQESNEHDDESEGLSDIDDVEVDGYLLDKEEVAGKTTIWEIMYKDHMEKQATKEASDAVKYQNSSGEVLSPEELAAATKAAVAKTKKEKREKRAEQVNAAPAKTPADALCPVLTKKRLSTKINYDVLKQLLNEPSAYEDSKRKRNDSNDNDFGNTQQHKNGNKQRQSDVVDEDNDNLIGQEDEFEEEENAGGRHGNDLYDYGGGEDENAGGNFGDEFGGQENGGGGYGDEVYHWDGQEEEFGYQDYAYE